MIPSKGLPPEAYQQLPGDQYPPYIPASQNPPELTVKAILIGVLLGIVFGAANAYLGLRVGMTVSASIPAAVMSIALFRLLRRGTILETNIVQTIGSAGESLAAGVIFTLPALIIWGLPISQLEVFTLSALGGLLGVLFMIPLRRFLISSEHGKLPFPEGTACAEVQVAGESGGVKAKLVFWGLGLGGLYKLLSDSHAFKLWNAAPSVSFPGKVTIGAEATPELLGVGYIIGWRISLIMFSGGALAWLIIIPLLNAYGGPAIHVLAADDIWDKYIRYIGAGGVAYGGVITLVKSFPTIVASVKLGLGKINDEIKTKASASPRTDRDLSLKFVGVSLLLIALALDLIPFIPVNFLAALLMVVFAFFFVTVSSRIVGLIGASSNPVSGMTIAALLATTLIFVFLGVKAGGDPRPEIIAVGAIVCIAAAIAGDTSQDLKTGFLLGATPYRQQIAEIIGVLTAATVMGAVLIMLNKSYTIGSQDFPAPQATLMSLVIDGVLSHNLPCRYVLIGVALSAFVEHVLRQPALPFAVGLYLPLSLSTPILLGGAIRLSTESFNHGALLNEKRERGVLFSSGLIAGAALVGVLIAALIFFSERSSILAWITHHWTVGYDFMGVLATFASIVIFAALAFLLFRVANAAGSSDR